MTDPQNARNLEEKLTSSDIFGALIDDIEKQTKEELKKEKAPIVAPRPAQPGPQPTTQPTPQVRKPAPQIAPPVREMPKPVVTAPPKPVMPTVQPTPAPARSVLSSPPATKPMPSQVAVGSPQIGLEPAPKNKPRAVQNRMSISYFPKLLQAAWPKFGKRVWSAKKVSKKLWR